MYTLWQICTKNHMKKYSRTHMSIPVVHSGNQVHSGKGTHRDIYGSERKTFALHELPVSV